jgi:nucleotide-binding universal stress UspA family protein
MIRCLPPEAKPVPVLAEGRSYVAIVEQAEQLGADLIVLGTHGRTGVAHALLGSVAERVVRSSPIPVITVRAPG